MRETKCALLVLVASCYCLSVLFIHTSHGFVLDGSSVGNCLYSQQRGTNTLNCRSKGFTNIPQFRNMSNLIGITALDFSENHITTIAKNTFSTFSNLAVESIDFSRNQISSVHPGAFTGVEHVKKLDFAYNQLHALPQALTSLTSLQNLELYSNPLLSLDASIMYLLSNSLTEFSFNMQYFSTWPSELSFAHNLEVLRLHSVPFTTLDAHAFDGLENSLTYLDITSFYLEYISSSICSLSKLDTIWLAYCPFNQTRHEIFEACTGNLLNISYLIIGQANVPVFPDLKHTFASIENIFIRSSHMNVFNANSVLNPTSVKDFDFSKNNLAAIPAALSVFVNVYALDLMYNRITSIHDTDLMTLTKLEQLYLQHNPLRHIANNAFKHNHALNYVLLHDTPLHSLPTSITLLPNLGTLFLSNTLIECSCANLSNLKPWDVTNIAIVNETYPSTVMATCYRSSKTFNDYIMHELLNC